MTNGSPHRNRFVVGFVVVVVVVAVCMCFWCVGVLSIGVCGGSFVVPKYLKY